MNTIKMGDDHCPHCGTLLDAASDPLGDHKPSPGDLTICVGCGNICMFGDDFGLRKLEQEEYDSLPPELRVKLFIYQAALERAKQKE